MKKSFYYMILIVFAGSLNASIFAQDSVIIIRHGEKPDNGDNLSCKGLNRALGLSEVLYNKIGVPCYTYVPSMKMGKETKHVRMFQLVTPFAVKYNLDINSKYDETDSTGVAAEVIGKLGKKQKHGTILLVWEHHNIMPVARALGVPASQVPDWPGTDFDSIWIITKPGKKSAALTISNEGLNGVSDICP